MAMQGYVKIGVGADMSQFDAQMKELKNKMQEAEFIAKDLGEGIEDKRGALQTITKEIERAEKGMLSEEKIMERIKKMSETFGIDFNVDYADLTKTMPENQAYAQLLKTFQTGINADLEEQYSKYQKIINKLDVYDSKMQKIQQQTKKQTTSIKDVSGNLDKLGSKMSAVITKVGKWALAVLGVRSIYTAITRSISVLSEYDDQLATDLKYISFVIAMSLKPVVEFIIKAIFQLLRALQDIVYRLFGINIFANATADAFNKTTKSAKDLKKQLTGFDEMNVLNDSSSSGVSTPSMDLSKLGEPIDWNELTGKAKGGLKGLIFDLSNIIDGAVSDIKKNITRKLFDAGFSNTFITGWQNVFDGVWGVITNFFAIWQSDIPKIIAGIVTGDTEKIRLAVGNLIEHIKGGLNGFWNFVKGIVMMIWSIIDTICQKIIRLFQNNPIQTSLNSMPDKVKWAFDKLKGFASDAWTGIKNVFSGVGTWFKDKFSEAWNNVKNVFSTGGKIFDGIKDGIETSFKTIVNKLIDGINRTITKPFEKINETLNKIHDVNILGLKPFSNLWKSNPISVPKIPKLATGAILNMPGKGVYHNGSIIAERGAEGILPLTDASAMRLLGQTIGEYITINANIENNMNGRLISRLIKQISAEQDFSYNR